MPKGVLVGGPHGGNSVSVSEIQTLPGWEIWVPAQGTTLRDIYRCSGEHDVDSRWIFRYIGIRSGEDP